MSEYRYQSNLAVGNNIKFGIKAATEFNPLANISNKTIGELKEEVLAEELEFSKNAEKAEKDFSTYSTYNVTNAKAYAQRWWNGRNPAYDIFPYDCTNFVSQKLFAGGKPMKLSNPVQAIHSNTAYWYTTSTQGFTLARSSS